MLSKSPSRENVNVQNGLKRLENRLKWSEKDNNSCILHFFEIDEKHHSDWLKLMYVSLQTPKQTENSFAMSMPHKVLAYCLTAL